MHGSYSEMKAISWVFPQFEFQSRECLFHALDCSMRLLGEIAVLLGVYNLRILAVGDCLTDVYINHSGICLQKSRHFGRISGYS